jgi:hypothetical protein
MLDYHHFNVVRNDYLYVWEPEVRHRRLPLAARRLKSRFGLADSLSVLVAELAGFPPAEGQTMAKKFRSATVYTENRAHCSTATGQHAWTFRVLIDASDRGITLEIRWAPVKPAVSDEIRSGRADFDTIMRSSLTPSNGRGAT